MDYEGAVRAILDGAGADVGDYVEITRESDSFKGIVMPHVQFSGEGILTLKLDNGYNIGIRIDERCQVQLMRKEEEGRKVETETQANPPYPYWAPGARLPPTLSTERAPSSPPKRRRILCSPCLSWRTYATSGQGYCTACSVRT
jgi:hypothetical protein